MEVDHEDPVTGASQALEVAAGDIIGKLKITKAKPPKLWPSADLSKSFLKCHCRRGAQEGKYLPFALGSIPQQRHR